VSYPTPAELTIIHQALELAGWVRVPTAILVYWLAPGDTSGQWYGTLEAFGLEHLRQWRERHG
jgi:hypothetical protein